LEERLQKIISRAGLCSRREAESMISEGRVTVNGQTVTELGSKADPSRDHIKVNGKLLQKQETFVYILLYKPKGVLSAVVDPEGRPVVTDLIKGVKARLYPVGRLDFQTEGALLLTNDGELSNQLLNPKNHCPKTYLVKVSGSPDPKTVARLQRGITADGVRYGSCEIEVLRIAGNCWLKVVLFEGKNNQIRNMFAAVGHPVSKLKRIAFASLTIKDLEVGQWRELTESEIDRLKDGGYKPPVPLKLEAFLKSLGVNISYRDRERLRPYKGAPAGAKTVDGSEAPERAKPLSSRKAGAEGLDRVRRKAGEPGYERKTKRPTAERDARPQADRRERTERPQRGRSQPGEERERPSRPATSRSRSEGDRERPSRPATSRSRSEGDRERPSRPATSRSRSEGDRERPSRPATSRSKPGDDRERPSRPATSRSRSEGDRERPSRPATSRSRSEGDRERPSRPATSRGRSEGDEHERPSRPASGRSKPASDRERPARPASGRSKPSGDREWPERPSRGERGAPSSRPAAKRGGKGPAAAGRDKQAGFKGVKGPGKPIRSAASRKKGPVGFKGKKGKG